MNYYIDNNALTFSNKFVTTFEYSISKVLEINDSLIVILDIPNDVSYRRNVFSFDLFGGFLWQIQDIRLYFEGPWCPYVNANINEDNELVLFNWCDTAIVVDSFTGNLIRRYITK